MTVLTSALLMSPATAEPRLLYGAGMISCGEWQQYRISNDRAHVYQAQAWVDGYLSGFNVASSGPPFLTSKPSSVAFYAWLDNYCAQNPLDLLATAAFRLQQELATRNR
jgi:hypothetical protein